MKINILTGSFDSKNRTLIHVFRIMKICLFFLFVITFQTMAINTKAQDAVIELKTNSVTVGQLIKQIEKQTDYLVVYSNREVDTSRKVNFSKSSDKVYSYLNSAFSNTDIGYNFENDYIVLSKRANRNASEIAKLIEITQQQTGKRITGKVVDINGESIIGVNVLEVGTTNGTVTDINGDFELNVANNATIHITYIGYHEQTISTTGSKQFEIVLTEDQTSLDEVVVVAFGKMAREAFTGSAGVIKSDELTKAQVSNPVSALAGRVAGVQLSNSSSQLGSSPSITIRGFGSISSDTEPLIIVDGMPYDEDLNLINPSDIESMTVLKDAASNALYGARGANGVIMITTKRGRGGDTKITFDSKWGSNSNGLKNYETTNSQQFYETYYKMLNNYYLTSEGGSLSAAEAHTTANSHLINSASGVGPGYMVYSVPNGEDFIQQGGVMNPNATMGALYNFNNQKFWLQADDWEKEGLQNGFRQEYNISLSGASDRINYYTSLGYLSQEGIQEGSSQDRLTARMKLDYQAKKWMKVGANFSYTNYQYNQTSEGTIGTGTIWSTIKTLAPVYPVYYRDENKNIMIDQWGEKMYDFARNYDLSRAGGVGGNAIFSNKYNNNETNGNSYIASGYVDFLLTNDLTFTMNANNYTYDRRGTYVTSPFVDHYTDSDNNGYLSKGAYRTSTYNLQQLLNYIKQFDKHEVTTLLGHEYYNYKYEYLNASGYNFGIDGIYELAAMLNKYSDPYSYSSAYNNEGYFFRGMYNYDQKYFGSLSYRRDASSRFAKNHRWGNFWSLGGAWILSKENFFNANWVNSLKLKLSVGSQGNDNIGNYLYANTYSIVNSDNDVAYQWRQKGSESITWETNTNWNTGIEFQLFNNRLNGSLDYFYRKTTDMLFSLNTPPSIGYTSYVTNLGDMRNSGVELGLQGILVDNRDFYWDVNFNISHVKNKVLSLPEGIKSMNVEGYDGYVNLDISFVSKYKYFVGEGLPLYTWYLPKYAGLDSETGESLYYKDIMDEDGNVTGQETIKDINQATDYLIGDALPSLYGGFGTTLRYRDFDFSVNTNFQLGGKAYDYTYQTLMHSGGTTATTWHLDMLNAWTPENTNTDVPRLLYSEKYSQNSRSDRFITDASYLNIQNINFGYTLPSQLSHKFNIENIRIYFSGENLFYLSSRQGFDPRYTLKGFTNPELYSPIRTLSGGISLVF